MCHVKQRTTVNMSNQSVDLSSKLSPLNCCLSFVFRSDYVMWLAQCVELLSESQLAEPQWPMPDVPKHLERIVDKKTFVLVEDKLQILAHPTSVREP